jgi:predicted NAD/FAD-dependent oxidoreductase
LLLLLLLQLLLLLLHTALTAVGAVPAAQWALQRGHSSAALADLLLLESPRPQPPQLLQC